jgi:hypothetical protein
VLGVGGYVAYVLSSAKAAPAASTPAGTSLGK